MTFVDGQGGNISINGVILQPTAYRIGRILANQDVTTTGAGGWKQRKRVINDWNFEAHFFFDAAHPPANIIAVNGVYVPQGIESELDGSGNEGVPCIFQIGASAFQYQGTALLASNNPGIMAQGTVDLTISGECARGPLVGPVAGTIS
jgi:hypothetical protein